MASNSGSKQKSFGIMHPPPISSLLAELPKHVLSESVAHTAAGTPRCLYTHPPLQTVHCISITVYSPVRFCSFTISGLLATLADFSIFCRTVYSIFMMRVDPLTNISRALSHR